MIKLYKRSYEQKILEDIKKRDFSKYGFLGKKPGEEDLLTIQNVNVNTDFHLKRPDSNGNYDFENSKIVYENLSDLPPNIASDGRFWSYLAHEKFLGYSKSRWPVDFRGEQDKIEKNILKHYFIKSSSASNFVEHSIARLWWSAYMTLDPSSENKYWLTEELMSHANYRKVLVTYLIARNKKFLKTFLKFVVENQDHFEKGKQEKIEQLMKKLNLLSSYSLIASMEDYEIYELLLKETEELELIHA